jgi:hypothetical protein
MAKIEIDGIVPKANSSRAVGCVVKNGTLGVGIYYQGEELFSAPGLLLCEAILRCTEGNQAKNWLAAKSKC